MLTLSSFTFVSFLILGSVWWACKNDDYDSAK